MNKPLALWCHARARSTAMARMMFERGDHRVFDEPFARAYYFSDQRTSERRADIKPDPALRFPHVLSEVRRAAQAGPVFVKDHAYHVVRHATPGFLSVFRNAFLIRDPAEALPSLFARMPDASDEETGYAALSVLADMLEREGEDIVVLDAGDLISTPREAIGAWCSAVGLDFIPGALEWAPGIPEGLEACWWGDPAWHRHLSASSGFSENATRNYPALNDDPRLLRAYERCLPHYLRLKQRRLDVRAAGGRRGQAGAGRPSHAAR